ncbi:unnamed protein product [Effrenium voratum]|nr:unnamed protein product [Effrenium voratum]
MSCSQLAEAKGEHPMDLAGRRARATEPPSRRSLQAQVRLTFQADSKRVLDVGVCPGAWSEDAAQASLQSPRSVVPIEAVQVSPGKGIRLQGRKLLFGAMPQDVVSDFGPPQQVCVKDVDAFRIHSRTPRSPNLDYYYNYFYLGLDALFDGQTHLLQKIVLHTNPPTHERFSRYTRCFFQLQLQEDSGESEVADDAQGQKQRKLAEAEPTSDEGDGEARTAGAVNGPMGLLSLPRDGLHHSQAAAASPRVSVPEDTVPPQAPGRRPTVDVRWQWQDIEEALRTAGLAKSKPLVMDQSRYTSFGSTYFYGFPGVVFEVMQNSYLASLTLFRSWVDAMTATAARRFNAPPPMGCVPGMHVGWGKEEPAAEERPPALLDLPSPRETRQRVPEPSRGPLQDTDHLRAAEQADLAALQQRDPALQEVMQDELHFPEAEAALELYRRSLIALDADRMRQQAFRAVVNDDAEDLRRLFTETTLRWDAENAGGQCLMEVALERQRSTRRRRSLRRCGAPKVQLPLRLLKERRARHQHLPKLQA